jgi:hypothetical protein
VTVDDRVGLVFSWDPRAQHWVKERGPEDAPPPPADPIDNGAVQTYYLDTATGRWSGTILGLKGRQISVELGDKYRAARMVGLAIIAKAAPKAGAVQTYDQKKKSAVPLMAGLAAVVVVIAAGAFAAQAVMKPKDAVTLPSASVVATASALPVDATSAPATPEPAATPAPTIAPTQQPVSTPVRTVPPPPPAQQVTFTARLSTGQTVTYSSPSTVTQGAVLDGVVSVRTPNGSAATEPITVYVGPLGTAQTLTLTPDRNGNYVFSLRISLPKGSAPISVQVGSKGELRTLGSITVR